MQCAVWWSVPRKCAAVEKGLGSTAIRSVWTPDPCKVTNVHKTYIMNHFIQRSECTSSSSVHARLNPCMHEYMHHQPRLRFTFRCDLARVINNLFDLYLYIHNTYTNTPIHLSIYLLIYPFINKYICYIMRQALVPALLTHTYKLDQ